MIYDSRETQAKQHLVEKLEEKIEEEHKKEDDLKMMTEMYGLLEPTQSERDAAEQEAALRNKPIMERQSTTSSVNTQYIDE